MRTRKSFWLLFSLFCLVSCATTTKVVNLWKNSSNPNFKIHKALIIFVSDHAPVQESFENAFITKLHKADIEAYAGYKVLLTDQEVNKEFILQKVKTIGVDSVIVTKVIDTKKKTIIGSTSPYNVPFAQFNIELHERNIKKFGRDNPSGYIAMFDKVSLKTTVYSVVNQEPVWFLESDTLTQDTFDKLVDTYLDIIITNLQKDQLL